MIRKHEHFYELTILNYGHAITTRYQYRIDLIAKLVQMGYNEDAIVFYCNQLSQGLKVEL